MLSKTISDSLADLNSAVQAVEKLDWDRLPVAEQLEAMERLEVIGRRTRACLSDAAASVTRGGPKVQNGTAHRLVADVLRISPAEARRRIQDAAQLAPRTTLTGQSRPPELPATAKAWHSGLLDIEHLRVVQRFMRDLPDDIPPAAAEKAEEFLAEKAAELRPDQLDKLAQRLAMTLNPDGAFSDEYRSSQRGFQWCGRQRPDGMSVARLVATPELRAMLEAWMAKFAAPGMCNPADNSPTVSGEPSRDCMDRDARTSAHRQHDALAALVRGQLGDPSLGNHNGLPVTVVVSATLEQLQTAAGAAVTAGGTLLPMPDLIRMASHAYHYLCIFDKHTERALYLGRTKRIASADQRIVLHAKDRGCTAPGCDVPGYLCETHHVDEWTDGGRTDVDRLTFACGPHHRLIGPGGWQTRKRRDGSTEWLPPPGIPLRGGTNDYHHPERLLPGGDDIA